MVRKQRVKTEIERYDSLPTVTSWKVIQAICFQRIALLLRRAFSFHHSFVEIVHFPYCKTKISRSRFIHNLTPCYHFRTISPILQTVIIRTMTSIILSSLVHCQFNTRTNFLHNLEKSNFLLPSNVSLNLKFSRYFSAPTFSSYSGTEKWWKILEVTLTLKMDISR